MEVLSGSGKTPEQTDMPTTTTTAVVREKTDQPIEPKQDVPELGPRMLGHFMIDASYRNLNHGSWGTYPRAIQKKVRHYQDLTEAMPDTFLRYEYPKLLEESRAAVAKLLNAPTDTVVFVANASTGVDTVFRNINWNEDGLDEIIYFSVIYDGCATCIDRIVDFQQGRVSAREITLRYPMEDDEILALLRSTIEESKALGKRPRLCILDAVVSLPAVRFPFEQATRVCKEAGLLSLVDGAQGIGMIEIDLSSFDPDFFITNCHKWLFTPRGCAVFYVPERNQHMITATLPTSRGYISQSTTRFNPMTPSKRPPFVKNFDFVGTMDDSSYMVVKDAIEWRQEVLGGEERIRNYIIDLAKRGGRKVADILGTEVMENTKGTLTNCGMVNVALPIKWTTAEVEGSLPMGDMQRARQWMLETMTKAHKTFIPVFKHQDRLWVRLSAQVYLDVHDFEWAGNTLLGLCKRAKKGDYKA